MQLINPRHLGTYAAMAAVGVVGAAVAEASNEGSAQGGAIGAGVVAGGAGVLTGSLVYAGTKIDVFGALAAASLAKRSAHAGLMAASIGVGALATHVVASTIAD